MRKFLLALASTLAMTTSSYAVAAVVSVPSAAASTPTVLRFDELPFQAVDGLTYKGVTFNFAIAGVPSGDAFYDAADGGNEKYVQDPSLEGNARGALTLTFATPTHYLQFGLTRSASLAFVGGVVTLYGPHGGLIATYSIPTQVYVTYTEGLFTRHGRVPVKRAVM